jgi:hypothetical protein
MKWLKYLNLATDIVVLLAELIVFHPLSIYFHSKKNRLSRFKLNNINIPTHS